jgi:glycosyltransferase involved in cell wall biosynthesis/organic radical activating enzyme
VLAAVAAADERPTEVVVVDDASTDQTVTIAESFGTRVLRLRAQMGAGYCRNFGARAALGDLFVFLDADVVPARNYLSIIRSELDGGAGGVGGRYLSQVPGRFNRLCELQDSLYWERQSGSAEVLSGGLCAFTRQAWNSPARTFQEVRLFPQMASGEDFFVCEEIRKTHSLVYRSDLVGTHLTDLSRRFLARSIRQGYSRTTNLIARHFTGMRNNIFDSFRVRELLLSYLLVLTAVLARTDRVTLPAFVLAIAFFARALWPELRRAKTRDLPLLVLISLQRQAGWIVGTLWALGRPARERARDLTATLQSAWIFLLGHEVSKLYFFVTNRCNSRCSWCLDLHRSADNPGATKKEELSVAEITQMARSKNAAGRIPYLILTGGEPFLREDLDQLVQAFYLGLGTRFLTIVSNGSFPDRIAEQVERMLILCPSLRLNLCLTVADIGRLHDDVRRHSRSHELLLESRKRVAALQRVFPKLIFSVSSQLDDRNAPRAPGIIEHVKESFGPDEHFVTFIRDTTQRVTPPGPGLDHVPAMGESVRRAHPGRKSLFQSFYNEVVQRALLELVRIRRGQAVYRPCTAGRKFATLYENGNVMVCENRQDLMIGNVRDAGYGLTELLRGRKARELRSRQLCEKCSCDWGPAVTQNLMTDPVFLLRSLTAAWKAWLIQTPSTRTHSGSLDNRLGRRQPTETT